MSQQLECLLLSHEAGVQTLAPTSGSSNGSDPIFWILQAPAQTGRHVHMRMHAHTLINLKNNFEIP